MTSMKEAFYEVGFKKLPLSPFNPSKSAITKVKNPLPIPLHCPNCQSDVALANNKVIYGREYGDWPWVYRCLRGACDSYVGLHPFTDIPLGTLANAETREARKKAKAAFNPMWEKNELSRSDAYRWLANQLGIKNAEECHIGWFDVATCNKVVIACELHKKAKHD